MISEVNNKLIKFNNLKNYANNIELLKPDYDNYCKNKKEFLLINNIENLKENNKKLNTLIQSHENTMNNKNIYIKLMTDKEKATKLHNELVNNNNMLDGVIKLYSNYNKVLKDSNLQKLNTALDDDLYTFDDNYEIKKS